ncbi:VC0807 family protein [Consotaella salsifontis]|uniref:Intracellular septation protein A n=1 Tax=Consotaella salsifontis TaxID=1365950 RepID=A0A1T4MY17_9HYPH|nr:VC0807 family protein [Consotaella salsifontis]SJZ71801.1 hypothetical protein SAMN05428963_102338 [Consotaella salsifontis]
MLKDIIVSVLLPYGTYLLLTRFGLSSVAALSAGALFPAASVLLDFVRSRRVQALGLIVLSATIASVLGALMFDEEILMLAKGSMITAVVGMVFAASLMAERPLVFHFVAGSDSEARQEAEHLWQTAPRYRQVLRTITLAWAVALFVEAGVRLVLIPLLPIAVFLPISESMWIIFFAVMTAWSWRYGRRAMAAVRQGEASGQAQSGSL